MLRTTRHRVRRVATVGIASLASLAPAEAGWKGHIIIVTGTASSHAR